MLIEESERKKSCGNGSSGQRQSLHGCPPTLHGPFAVMPYVGDGTADMAFNEAHMRLQERAFQANIFIVDMVFLGDTRSAEELAVFTNMAPERLCLGCGLRVEENFTPILPGERGSLFAASVKLLQFALRASSASASANGLIEEEGILFQAIRPLVTNPDCHFLAVLTVLVQSILEGRMSHQWSLWGRENPCGCHDCWIIGDGSNTEGNGGNQGERSGACLRQAH